MLQAAQEEEQKEVEKFEDRDRESAGSKKTKAREEAVKTEMNR